MANHKSVIIGCGVRAHGHAVAYREVYGGKLVACANLSNEKRLQEFASTYNITGYNSVENMLCTEKPDLVHIVTLPDQWLPLVNLISDLGVPACLMEKPVATGVDDWQKLRKLEEESDTKFGVNMQVRWHPLLQECQRAMKRIGNIKIIDFSCAMNIARQGVHILDWAMSLNEDSPIVKVFGNASGVEPLNSDYPAPESTIAYVVFENGTYGIWNTGSTAPRTLVHPDLFGLYDEMVDNFDEEVVDEADNFKYLRIAAHAELGNVQFEEFGDTKTRIVTETGDFNFNESITPESWVRYNNIAQTALTDAMFTWIRNDDKPVKTSLKNALHQWNAVLGVYESAVTNQPVNIPFEPNLDLMSRLRKRLSKPSVTPPFGILAHQS